MKDLQQQLSEADPVGFEPALSQTDVERMRRVVLLSARGAAPLRVPWLALAATLLAVVAGVVVTRTPPAQVAQTDHAPVANGDAQPTTRQLQFSTAGGTRVIWMFNPDFDVR